jgi:hypothetical protein
VVLVAVLPNPLDEIVIGLGREVDILVSLV